MKTAAGLVACALMIASPFPVASESFGDAPMSSGVGQAGIATGTAQDSRLKIPTPAATDTATEGGTVYRPDPPDWPGRFFAPYVDATGWPTFDLVGCARDEGVLFFAVGFIVANVQGGCEATWGTYYPIDQGFLVAEIDSIRSMGGDVIVSFGGAANTELAAACGSVSSLKNAYQSVIDAYNLTHIDFDIEGALTADPVSIERRSAAIAALEQDALHAGRDLYVWYTLPVLPTGLTQDGLNVVESALDHGVVLAGVNIMAMDYGDDAAPEPDGNMGEYAIQAATSLFHQMDTLYRNAGLPKTQEELWQMIGITPMIGLNDVTTEIFYQEDAQEVLTFGQQQNVGMLSFWSANRDKQCPEGQTHYVSPNCSSILQEPFEFSHIFLPFTGGAAWAAEKKLPDPELVSLDRPVPNPFGPRTTILFDLAAPAHITLSIYDPAGRLVEALVNGYAGAGRHAAVYEPSRLPSGTYFCRLHAGGRTITRILTLMK